MIITCQAAGASDLLLNAALLLKEPDVRWGDAAQLKACAGLSCRGTIQTSRF